MDDLDEWLEDDVEEVPRVELSDFPSRSSSGIPVSTPDGSENSSSGAETSLLRVRRRPIPRKGHTKSRNGCYNCKRRKVKCQETLPECGHCARIGLVCEYPPSPQRLQSPSPSMALQSTPTTFSMEDLRFFTHFLQVAYPPLPILGDDIWRDVATISHGFDYLIHAMLGIGASHLGLLSDADYSPQALVHRVAAIKSLNNALNTPCATKSEGDARFATVLALTFQASYLPEGMLEFLSMVRGCHVVAATSMLSYEESLFAPFSAERHFETVKKLNEVAVPRGQDEEVIDPFLKSVRALAPLCHSATEVKYLAGMEKALRLARTSSVDAFGQFSHMYTIVAEASTGEFTAFIDPDNYTAQLLLIHFFLIEAVIAGAALGPFVKAFQARQRITRSWLERLVERIPQKYLPYVEWPLQLAKSIP